MNEILDFLKSVGPSAATAIVFGFIIYKIYLAGNNHTQTMQKTQQEAHQEQMSTIVSQYEKSLKYIQEQAELRNQLQVKAMQDGMEKIAEAVEVSKCFYPTAPLSKKDAA